MKTTHPSAIRRNELLALISDGSTDEKVFNDLKMLNEVEANAKKAWSDVVRSIVDTMVKNEPSIGIADLITANVALRPNIDSIYDVDTYIAGAKVYGLSVSKIPNEKVGGGGIPGILNTKKLGIAILKIKVPGAKGQATTIYQHSPLPANTTDKNKLKNAFVYVKSLEGDINSNMIKLANEQLEVQKFLSSAEGDQFINKWAGWISRGGKRS